jgi:hypothetical protein
LFAYINPLPIECQGFAEKFQPRAFRQRWEAKKEL